MLKTARARFIWEGTVFFYQLLGCAKADFGSLLKEEAVLLNVHVSFHLLNFTRRLLGAL